MAGTSHSSRTIYQDELVPHLTNKGISSGTRAVRNYEIYLSLLLVSLSDICSSTYESPKIERMNKAPFSLKAPR